MKTGATSEDKLVAEVVVAGDEANQLGQKQVLLDMVRGWLWRPRAPRQ